MLNKDKLQEPKIYLLRIKWPDNVPVEGAYTELSAAMQALEELNEAVFSSGIQEIALNKRIEDDSKGYIFRKQNGIILPFDKNELFY
ncbi:hypothetical protein [Sulfurospirillum multivorans]|uniref:Uncharacterized protein n=2 Tax=Sulfurospirillum multivorans TaxID=66821 RepID=A0AA86AM87_SULMK|nr:hypothetical protein [Sulfurospirillum multivorans]AHJ13104.1 hypothetical protein SMUL_1849 [Sulfurospirillum multivorans DSM 12446]QEH06592.1 hypothetical protein SMN_1827 [Sulfurospirillum multivorans]